MKIDVNKPEEFKKLTIDDLLKDAVARKDKEAALWLKAQSDDVKTRTRKDGTKYEARKSIVEIRPVYLKKFCGYKPKVSDAKERARLAKKQKIQKELDDKFMQAFAELGIE